MEITQISTEQLDNLFGQESVETTQDTHVVDTTKLEGTDSLPVFDLDNLDTPEPEVKTEIEPEVKIETEPEVKAEIEDVPEKIEETEDIKEVLKNTVSFLIEKGKWQDFEGREDLDLTMDVYSELAMKQNEAAAIDMFNELVDSTGGYGKAILSHIKEGGNPDEIIDLFKEQKQIEAIDINTDIGKLTKIQKYYSDVIGWRPEKVKKHLDRIITDNDIDSELFDVNEKYDEFYQDQLLSLESDRIEREHTQKENQRVFTEKIKNVIYSDKDYSDKEKKMLEQSILTFKHKLEDGSKVNDFYVKFAEMQADPKLYVKLVHFVTDPEGFETKVKTKTETKAAVKAFNFIKGNNTVSKDKGTAHVSTHKDDTKPKIDFSTLIKQK